MKYEEGEMVVDFNEEPSDWNGDGSELDAWLCLLLRLAAWEARIRTGAVGLK
jgi:hypothetical protein